jgi:hypothetical protein
MIHAVHFDYFTVMFTTMTTSEKLCDPCQFNTESVKAVSWCSTCEEGLCKSCEKSHRSLKIISNHVVVPLEEMNSDQSFHRYAYFFVAIHWTGPRLSLIVLSPQPQYRWILQFHTSDVKMFRIEYNRVSKCYTGHLYSTWFRAAMFG